MLNRLALMAILSGGLTACGPAANSTPAEKPAAAQAASKPVDGPKMTIKSVKLADGFYMLTGPGGNIGVSSGEDGLFVIDDKFDRFGEEIIIRLREISDGPIRYVLNTHYHGDHTGANAKMKSTGAVVTAHENVRTRMGITFDNKLFGRPVKATAPEQWPMLTYSENATFYFNGQTVRAIHTPSSHTDGDTIVYFEQGDILHMGDNFFNGNFPYIDIDSGGSLQGMIASHNKALSMVGDNTKIIPGHGPLAAKSDLIKTRDVLKDVMTRVQARIDQGQNLEAMLADNPLKGMGRDGWFINEETMGRIAFRSLTER